MFYQQLFINTKRVQFCIFFNIGKVILGTKDKNTALARWTNTVWYFYVMYNIPIWTGKCSIWQPSLRKVPLTSHPGQKLFQLFEVRKEAEAELKGEQSYAG